MENLKIEYVPIDSITPYEGNAKLHPAEQIEQIKRSIQDNGMNDPIGIWHDTVVEGHGRLIACKELGMTEVPVIRLDHMTDEQRRQYMLIHNQTTMNSGFDMAMLSVELDNLPDFDADFYGIIIDEEDDTINPYTSEIRIPQYEPSGRMPDIKELCDTSKSDELIAEIQDSGCSDEEKLFLIEAAQRHNCFNYQKVAEYYAGATAEMQRLMEKSALVLIDYDDAIANGFVELSNGLRELRESNA